MTRILFIIPTLDRSGAEKQLTLLATRLPRDEFEVEVCCLTRGGPFTAELEVAGIKVTVIGKRLKIDPVAAWKLRGVIRRGRFDIVHTWLFAANWHGRAMAWLCGVPVLIASERCADEWKGSLELMLDRWLAPKTAAIIGNSQAVARYYESVGIARDKLRVIPNGIVLDSLVGTQVNAVDRAALRAELRIPADAFVLGFVGRLWPQKRVRDLIWATELLRNFLPNILAAIVGDGPERDNLVDFATKTAIHDRIVFVGQRDDVPRLMPAFDIFVLPSEFEGMPNVVLEAMAAGLPVVASNIPGTDEVVADGETGLLYPVGDTKALAKCVNRLIEDAELRRRFGAAGHDRVHQHFGVDRMVASHVALYRELMKKGFGARD